MAPLTSMLKTAAPPERLTLEKVGDGEGGDGVDCGGVEIAKKSGKLKGQKMSKSRKLSKSEKNSSKNGNSSTFNATESGPSFLTPEARSAFNRLRLAFTEALIFWHFDPKCHIRIETNALGYAIGGVLSQLVSGTSPDGVVTKADLGQWHPVAFFFRKKHEVLVLTDHNNLRCFMDTKSLGSKQVRWDQELFCYHFQIDYCQGKANAAADALSRFFQKS